MKARGGVAQCPAQQWTSGSLTVQKNTSHRDKGGEQGAREQEYKQKREGERERQRHSSHCFWVAAGGPLLYLCILWLSRSSLTSPAMTASC